MMPCDGKQSGARRQAGTLITRVLPTPSPCPEGQGQRRLDCHQYARCLERAAQEDWPGFSCQRCHAYTPDPDWRKHLCCGSVQHLVAAMGLSDE